MNKKVIIAVSAAVAIAAAVLYKLANTYYYDPHPDAGLYEDRSTLTEPEIMNGRYYLNGDTDECYLDVSGSTILLSGPHDKLVDLYLSVYVDYDSFDSAEKNETKNSVEKDIALWDEPKEFYVRTFLYPSEESYRSGVLNAENCDKEATCTILMPSDENNNWSGAIAYSEPDTLVFKSKNFMYSE